MDGYTDTYAGLAGRCVVCLKFECPLGRGTLTCRLCAAKGIALALGEVISEVKPE